MKLTNVNYLLRKMVAAGEAEKEGYGAYVSPPQTPKSPQSSTTHYPPKSVEVETVGVGNSEESEDSEGGTPSSDEPPGYVPAFLRRAA